MGHIKKFPDWEERFIKVLEELRTTEYEYGTHDCCISVANCVLAITGVDLASEFRGYNSEKEAGAFKKTHKGVLGIAKKIMKDYSCEEVPRLFAQRGDIVLIKSVEVGMVAGIVDLSGRRILTAAKIGWHTWPLEAAQRAWRLG